MMRRKSCAERAQRLSFLHDSFNLIEPYIRQYGVAAVFVVIYLESFGLPLPGESAVIGASVIASRGEFSIVGLFLAVWTGAVLGDMTGYAIGRFGGKPLLQRYGWVFRITPERQGTLEDLFRRRGPIIVVGARFIVVLRQLNGLIAGSVGMSFQTFCFANMLGAALWAGVWCFGPYFFGNVIG
jgi:membrane protein DedA with SNARE-associated domain